MGRVSTRNKYCGIMTMHEKASFDIFKSVLSIEQPRLIAELGHCWGGLTLLFQHSCPDAEIHAYDKKDGRYREKGGTKPDPEDYGPNINFHYVDLLGKPLDHLVNLCKDPRKKFLYCDNGNKVKEVQMYSPYLRCGDLLGVHDWGKEIRYDDIAEELVHFSPVALEILKENGCSTRLWRRI